MKTKFNQSHHAPRLLSAAIVATLLAVFAGSSASADDRDNRECEACKGTAGLALQAALAGAEADYWLAVAKASTLSSSEDRAAAKEEARDAYKESRMEAREQHKARLELCEALDECRYDPVINADDFLTPEQIAANPNPFLPLVPGTTRRYQAQKEDGVEVIEVTVTHDTREILGIDCIVVRDTVWLDGVLVEDTQDWFTQDKDGNVWYMGELSFNYDDGVLTGVEGSWEAGVDGAKPGIVMKANPQIGDVYRQEFLLGEAEDAAEVLALNESVTVPFGMFNNCLKTADFTPLEPDALEHKFYAPGIGLVLETDPESGERVELIAVETE